jgi:hypothetical protein
MALSYRGSKAMIGRYIPALALIAAPLPASAQEVPPVQVGAWTVSPISHEACHAAASFGEHVVVSISENSMGVGHFVLGDSRWLLKDGDVKPGRISWDEWKTSQEISFIAAKVGETWSLIGETGGWFTENLAGSKRFWLRVPGVEFDDDFNIPETMDVLSAISTCNDKL